MRRLSRWIPPAPPRRTRWWAFPVVAGFLLAGGYALLELCLEVHQRPWLISIPLMVAVYVWWAVASDRRRRRAEAAKRSAEDICTFVRGFDLRSTDPWILRAVYEEISKYILVDGRPFPIRPDDRLKEDLDLDWEDLEWTLAPDIFHRARRSVDRNKENPFYERVTTVRDLVRFLQYQRRVENVEPPRPVEPSSAGAPEGR